MTAVAGRQRRPRASSLVIVPLALAVHNAEEWLTIGEAIPRLGIALSELVGRPVALPGVTAYHLALGVITALAFAAYGVALRWPPALYALVVLQTVMALNVIVHVSSTLLLGGYAPGVVSAVLVEAPTSWIVFRRQRDEAWMSERQWRWLLPLALVMHGPVLLVVLALAERS